MMPQQPPSGNTFSNSVLVMAALVIIFAGLRNAHALVVPFLLSLFIATIAAGPVGWLKARGLSASLSVILVMLGLVILAMMLTVLMGSTIQDFSVAMPAYQERLQEMSGSIIQWLSDHGLNVSKSGIRDALDPGAVMRFANSLLTGIGSVLSNALLIMFTVMFMLLEAWDLPDKFDAMQSDHVDKFRARMNDVIQSTKDYTSAKTMLSLITGVMIWAGVALVGLDFAVLWGFLAFLLNFIPTVGSILAGVPAVLLALVQLGFGPALIVLAIFLAVNMLIGNIVEPKLMGEKVGLSTLVVFMSMVFWGWLLGPVGMLLSVPLTMVVKFASMSSEKTRWFSILLGSAGEARG